MGAVPGRAVENASGVLGSLAIEDEVVDDRQLARGGRRAEDVGFGDRPAQAQLAEPRRLQCVASSPEQRDRTLDAVWRARVEGGGIVQQRSASSRYSLVHGWIRPGVTLITPQPAPDWKERK